MGKNKSKIKLKKIATIIYRIYYVHILIIDLKILYYDI